MTCTEALSFVEITLDTHAPVLAIEAVVEVEPPDEWVVIVRASEAIGTAFFEFEDSLGSRHNVGFERIDDSTLRIAVPTVGLASAGSRLVGSVSDLVCNATVVDQPVLILRPRPFDVVFTMGHAYGVVVDEGRAFGIEADIAHAVVAQPTLDHAFESEQTFEDILDVETEVNRGDERG